MIIESLLKHLQVWFIQFSYKSKRGTPFLSPSWEEIEGWRDFGTCPKPEPPGGAQGFELRQSDSEAYALGSEAYALHLFFIVQNLIF